MCHMRYSCSGKNFCCLQFKNHKKKKGLLHFVQDVNAPKIKVPIVRSLITVGDERGGTGLAVLVARSWTRLFFFYIIKCLRTPLTSNICYCSELVNLSLNTCFFTLYDINHRIMCPGYSQMLMRSLLLVYNTILLYLLLVLLLYKLSKSLFSNINLGEFSK